MFNGKGLLDYINFLTNIAERNIGLEFRLRKIDKTRNCSLEEIKQKDLRVRSIKMFV